MHKLPVHFFKPEFVSFAGTLLIAAGLTTSRTLLSAGMMLVVLAAVLQCTKKGGCFTLRTPKLILAFSGLFALFAASALITEDLDRWADDLQVKLPLLVIPIAYGLLPAFSPRQHGLITAVLLACNSFLAALSLLAHMQQLGGPAAFFQFDGYIPLLTEINHIYFSVILAFAVLMGFWLFRRKTEALFRHERWVLLALSLLGLVCLHLLKSRTGVLSFYAGLGGMLLFTDLRQHVGKWLLGGASLAGLVVLVYLNVPFFQQRLSDSISDVMQYERPEAQREYSSISLRFKAWESAWEIYRRSPVLGAGISDIESQLIRQYRRDGFSARRSLWLDSVHNQYLESLAGSGLPGLLLLLFLLGFPLLFIRIPHPEVLAAFIALMACAMLTESLLERQIGIGFFVVGMMLVTAGGREHKFNQPFSAYIPNSKIFLK